MRLPLFYFPMYCEHCGLVYKNIVRLKCWSTIFVWVSVQFSHLLNGTNLKHSLVLFIACCCSVVSFASFLLLLLPPMGWDGMNRVERYEAINFSHGGGGGKEKGCMEWKRTKKWMLVREREKTTSNDGSCSLACLLPRLLQDVWYQKETTQRLLA